jgi:acyl carrier protein
MSYLLRSCGSQHIVAAIDWDTFKPLYEANGPQPFLDEILPKGQKPSLPTDTPPSELLNKLSQVTVQERRVLMTQYLRAQVASILGFTTSGSIGVQQGFFKLGMDSIMTMQLRTRLETDLSCSLPPTLAFEYPSIHTLVDYILKEILPQAGPSEVASTTLAIQSRNAEDASQADEHLSQAADENNSLDETASSNKELLDLMDQELSRIDDLLEGA